MIWRNGLTDHASQAEDLIAYVKANIEHQTVTTINIGIYQDGTIEQTSRQMMRQLRQTIRGK